MQRAQPCHRPPPLSMPRLSARLVAQATWWWERSRGRQQSARADELGGSRQNRTRIGFNWTASIFIPIVALSLRHTGTAVVTEHVPVFQRVVALGAHMLLHHRHWHGTGTSVGACTRRTSAARAAAGRCCRCADWRALHSDGYGHSDSVDTWGRHAVVHVCTHTRVWSGGGGAGSCQSRVTNYSAPRRSLRNALGHVRRHRCRVVAATTPSRGRGASAGRAGVVGVGASRQ